MVVDGLEPESLRALEALAAADDDAARRAARAGAHRREQAHAARADRHVDVAGVDPGTLHRMQRDRRGVAERRLVEVHRVGDLEHRLDRVDHVGRVRALRVVAVLPVAEVLAAVVEAQVVAAGSTHAAVAAAGMRRPGHSRSRHEAVARRHVARVDDHTRPLVSRDERVRPWPAALECALDDLGVGTADGDRAHLREHLVRRGARDRLGVAGLELVRRGEHERLHRLGGRGGTPRRGRWTPRRRPSATGTRPCRRACLRPRRARRRGSPASGCSPWPCGSARARSPSSAASRRWASRSAPRTPSPDRGGSSARAREASDPLTRGRRRTSGSSGPRGSRTPRASGRDGDRST